MKNLNEDVTGQELSDYDLALVIGGAPAAAALRVHVDNPGNTPLSFLDLLLPFAFIKPIVARARQVLRPR